MSCESVWTEPHWNIRTDTQAEITKVNRGFKRLCERAEKRPLTAAKHYCQLPLLPAFDFLHMHYTRTASHGLPLEHYHLKQKIIVMFQVMCETTPWCWQWVMDCGRNMQLGYDLSRVLNINWLSKLKILENANEFNWSDIRNNEYSLVGWWRFDTHLSNVSI
jgi:hypothetical protein